MVDLEKCDFREMEKFEADLDYRSASIWTHSPNWHVLDTNSDSLECKFCGKLLSEWNVFERCPSR